VIISKRYEEGVIAAFATTFKIDPNKIYTTQYTTMEPDGWLAIVFKHEGKAYVIGGVAESSTEIEVYINQSEFKKVVGEINEPLAKALEDNIRKELRVTPEKQINVKGIETGKTLNWIGQKRI